MTTPRDRLVHLGYAVPAGTPVEIPIRHMCVTGQTQESGKTTTLEALIARSRVRALTFLTKPGEGAFRGGHRIGPYFQEATENRWRFVASILEAHMGERMKFERNWISRASEGTRTLEDVRQKAWRLSETSRSGMNQDQYRMLGVYLDELVPAIAAVRWTKGLDLAHEGVSVMDLEELRPALQQLVIRTALETVLRHEHNVVVVVPEAWQFVPEGRNTPVKLAAVAFIRQGAARGNYLWLDSQDLGGVDKELLRSVPVWLVGVQREANEVKRTLQNIPAPSRPKAADVQTLELGEFIACWSKHAIRTYVQPAGMLEAEARQRAKGEKPHTVWQPRTFRGGERGGKTARAKEMESVGSILERVTAHMQPGEERTIELPATQDTVDQVKAFVDRGFRAQRAVDKVIADHTAKGGDDDMTPQQEKKLDDLLARFDGFAKTMGEKGRTSTPVNADGGAAALLAGASRLEELGDRELEHLVSEAADVVIERLLRLAASNDPKLAQILAVLVRQPELLIKVQKHTLEADGESVTGRLGILISEGHFDTAHTAYSAWVEFNARQWKHDRRTVERAVAELATKGFLRKEAEGYIMVSGMKRNVVKVPA